MNWLEDVSDAKDLLDDCLESERIHYSGHFNALLAEYTISVLQAFQQLKRSRHMKRYDYTKGDGKIPCYCFVAGKNADIVALTFFVSFEVDDDGTVQMWMQEFHP